MIIPLSWNKEHPITTLDSPTTWSLNHKRCQNHLLPEHDGISIELDDEVLDDPSAVVIGKIEKVDDEKITIIDDFLPDEYHN